MKLHQLARGDRFRLTGSAADGYVYELLGMDGACAKVRCLDEDRNRALCRQYGGGDFFELFAAIEVEVCGEEPRCRFAERGCPDPAAVRVKLSAGCVCYPADREQWLCLQHWMRCEPLGEAEVVEEL